MAARFEMEPLRRMLGRSDISAERVVRNIDNPEDTYVLCVARSRDARDPGQAQGVIAVLAPGSRDVLQYSITRNVGLLESIERDPGEELWWTRKPTLLPPFRRQQFYPFVSRAGPGRRPRTIDLVPVYTPPSNGDRVDKT
jgi:hypothetical protein